MREELNNFTRKKVWSLVDRPKGNRNVIGTKWVFKNMQDDHEKITRNKASLVAQGFIQTKSLDFGETFALLPVLSPFVSYLYMHPIMISN